MNLTDPDTLTKLGKLVLTDLVLAGDNAVVIALATRTLAPAQRFWGRMIGAGGAVGLRILFVAVIAFLLRVPFLQLVGGILLLWIAWKLVRPADEAAENEESLALKIAGAAESETSTNDPVSAAAPEKIPAKKKPAVGTLGRAIGMIVVADVTMSFDNVLAISNIAGDSLSLVIFGLLLSIPLVVWGSVLISNLMDRYRWIVWLGGAVLGHVAGDIIFKDQHVLGWFGLVAPAHAKDVPLDTLLAGASPLVSFIIHIVPWLFAVAIFLIGWLLTPRPPVVPKVEITGA